MIDRVRQLFGRNRSRTAARRYVTRREREEFQRRIAIIGVSIAAVALVAILATGAIYQYLYLPRQVLVSVNGANITRGDYWKVRKLDLINQAQQYSQIAQLSGGQQASQYQQLAQQALTQLQTVESDSPDPSTLSQMVDNDILLQRMGSLGVTITDADVNDLLANFFSPVPLSSPTPTLGVNPTAEAWATATAQVQATPQPSATPAATPAATPTTSAAATPGTPAATPEGTPGATPAATPSPSATPNPEQAAATATATYQQYKQQVLDQAGMSLDDFKRLVVRPQAAQQKVQYVLEGKIPTVADQVHAEHILVATEAAAKDLENQLKGGADFAQLAKEKSADSSTAVNGGDLGWFPRGVLPKALEDAAFSLQPGQISQPVRTEYGWDIIKVITRENNRPVDLATLQKLRGEAFSNWLDTARSQSKITWRAAQAQPTPTPVPQFSPPPGAPPTPTPTPSPTPQATPEGTPKPSATP